MAIRIPSFLFASADRQICSI